MCTWPNTVQCTPIILYRGGGWVTSVQHLCPPPPSPVTALRSSISPSRTLFCLAHKTSGSTTIWPPLCVLLPSLRTLAPSVSWLGPFKPDYYWIIWPACADMGMGQACAQSVLTRDCYSHQPVAISSHPIASSMNKSCLVDRMINVFCCNDKPFKLSCSQLKRRIMVKEACLNRDLMSCSVLLWVWTIKIQNDPSFRWQGGLHDLLTLLTY